ncbi:hypothetical protein ACFQ36_22155, partial [Arthrobacter sp. GCM10027362]
MKMHPVRGRRRAGSTVSLPGGPTGRGRRRADAPPAATLRRIGTFTGLAAAATGLAAAAVLPLVQAGSQDAAEDLSDLQTSATASSAVVAGNEGTPRFGRSAVGSEAVPRQAKESQPEAEPQPAAEPATGEERTAPATAAAREAAAPATDAASEATAA